MNVALVRDNLARVREEIDRIRCAEGVSGEVRIIAVTKGHPVEAISVAEAAGITDIGENRIQEALEKRTTAADIPVRWHLIGHLQSNKAKFVPGNFSVVHSVDSTKVADALARALRRWAGEGSTVEPLRTLLQVNVAGEQQKSGCGPDEAATVAHEVVARPELRLEGLMTMAPLSGDEKAQRVVFRGLRELRDHLASTGLALPELSMGMSGDFRAAVAEGATMVRLGTVLFGERQR
jgi:pyridoxal phosphate enzyme (YggS family)